MITENVTAELPSRNVDADHLSAGKTGGLDMSNNKKFFKGLMALFTAILAFSGVSMAASTATCVIYVTPPSEFSVSIDTPTGGINFGSVELDTVYISSAAGIGISTVTNNGQIVSDWKIRASVSDTWSLIPNSGNTKETVGMDQMNLCMVFKSTATSIIGESDFADGDMVDITTQNLDDPAFVAEAGYDGDNVGKDEKRHMFFRIRTPDNTTVTAQQRFRVIIDAYFPDEF